MNNIKVSIIVLTYNQEEYIEQTLNSIVSQEHNYSYEIIVCDDASIDTTPQIISDYAKNHNQIVPVLRDKNLGVAKNYYDAVSRCKGEYIIGIGGDDYFLPGRIKTHIQFLETHPQIGLLYGDIQIKSDNKTGFTISKGIKHSSLEHLLDFYKIYAPTITLRKSDLYQFIKEIEPTKKNWIMEDFPYVIWFYCNNKMDYIRGAYVVYRVLDDSISHQTSANKILEFRKSRFHVLQEMQRVFPHKFSNTLIYRHHLKDIVRHQNIISEYQEYCFDTLNHSKDFLTKYERFIFYLRIKYPSFNFLIRGINKLRKSL